MSDNTEFQFSLRGLLLLTTLCAVLFSVMRTLGVEMSSALGCTALIYVVVVIGMLLMRGSVVHAARNDPLSPRRIASVPHDAQATIIVEALSEAGIKAHLLFGETIGFLTGTPRMAHVIVAQQDLQRALEILSQVRAEQDDIDWSQVDVCEAPEDQPSSAEQPE